MYSHGADPRRFEYGVFLLNKNIEQVINAQGQTVKDLRATLTNLRVIYKNSAENAKQLALVASGAIDSTPTAVRGIISEDNAASELTASATGEVERPS